MAKQTWVASTDGATALNDRGHTYDPDAITPTDLLSQNTLRVLTQD